MIRGAKFALLAATAGAALFIGLGGRSTPAPAQGAACPSDAGLSLPPGFCATIFADNLGHTRHLVVAADGTLYANSWSGPYYPDNPPVSGHLIALRDTDGDGRADLVNRFGPSSQSGAIGGTGIDLYGGALYAEETDKIVRYALKPGEAVPSSPPVTILSGLPMTGGHAMHPFTIDAKGMIFVNSGSPSNVCERPARQPGSKGENPCTELATRAGIWTFDSAKTGQIFSAAGRYATGIRNSGGQAFDAAGRLFATQHGRDQLFQNWPAFYGAEQGAELPAEELLLVGKGDDFGWPYCYYDGFQNKLVLAPEYGGDGKKIGLCAAKKGPVAAYPAHWAPNDMMIYSGGQFPAAYQGGAFVAFHGSWNRAPAPQDGFNIVFQPLADGRAAGPSLRFADGFAGPNKAAGQADFRPTGLAQGPDGALYISDDVKGRVWRVTYSGPANAPLTAAQASAAATTAQGPSAPLPVPPGYTAAQVALGYRIYHGQERDGTCAGCHGADGNGASIGPALTHGPWLWSNGSVTGIAKVIDAGVDQPKKFPGGMPAKGGAPLSDSDVQAVAAYVWGLSHKS